MAHTDINTTAFPFRIKAPTFIAALLQPHRLVLLALALAGLVSIVTMMDWTWLPQYLPRLWQGLLVTLVMLVSSVVVGFVFALPLGLAQVVGPKPLKWAATAFCTIIRGTPLLLQMWLIYFGLGSLFAQFPEIRQSWAWPYLREAWPYGFFSLVVSFAAYEGEVMRGAFAGVPRGELEAARAFGMSPWKVFRRVWLPRAVHRALPTLTGEIILQLKSTPLVATITVMDLYAVVTKIRQATYLTYEPLLLLVAVYLCLSGILVVCMRMLENSVPSTTR